MSALSYVRTQADGFFGIGIYRAKSEANHGTLWRSAYQLGASFMFTIGARFDKHRVRSTDTAKAWAKIPIFQYPDFNAFAGKSGQPWAWLAGEGARGRSGGGSQPGGARLVAASMHPALRVSRGALLRPQQLRRIALHGLLWRWTTELFL